MGTTTNSLERKRTGGEMIDDKCDEVAIIKRPKKKKKKIQTLDKLLYMQDVV
jgi:hypothetical protein